VNNLPKVVTQHCLEQDWNLRPTDRKPKCLSVTPPRHPSGKRKVVNEHNSAAHTDLPDGGTGKTCLGGGTHCPSASSY